jgi:predicted permease
MFGELSRKLVYLLNRRRFERDLDEELRFHIESLEGSHGDPHAARRKFGNTAILKEASREMWGWSSLERLFKDIRYAVRQLAANPGFAVVAILSLALGIGANTAIFTLIDQVMLRVLPVSHPEELITIRGIQSYPQFEQLRDRNQVLSATIGSHFMGNMEVRIAGGAPGLAAGEMISGNYFPALGVSATLGRTILPEDDRSAESGPVAVISDGYWKRAFGASPDVLGRKIQVRSAESNGGTSGLEVYAKGRRGALEGAVLTIVGVARPEFFGDNVGKNVDIWIPITMQPAVMPGRPFLTQPNAVWVQTMARRKPGVSEAAARASLIVTWRQILTDAEGSQITDARRRAIAAETLLVDSGEKGFGNMRRNFGQPLLVLMTVVSLVLLIACLNVANLQLARATARRRELGVRLSLGAGRLRLIRQLLTESLVLALAGGAAGVMVAFVGTRLLIAMLASIGQKIAIPLETDFRMLGFTAAVSILSGILFGIAPALRATRISLAETMKDAGRGATSSRGAMAKILVGAQIGVSLLLLIGASLFLRTLYNLKTQDVGYNPNGLVLMRVDPVSAGYRGEEVGRSMALLLDRLRGLPGVRAATFSENGLFSKSDSQQDLKNVEGFTPHSEEDMEASFDQIGPQYFTHVGIPVLLGRDINERDLPGAPRVAVINETMAKFYFPGVNPVGKHISPERDIRLEIAGVVRDVQDHNFRDQPVRRFYVSYFQPIDGITTANFEVRTLGNPAGVMAELRNSVESFDRNLSILSVEEERQLMNQNVVPERLIATLSSVFGALAVLLAAIGLYGVMSYAVTRRTNEIGIRMALGAARSTVVFMILREVALLLAAGGIAGAAAAFASTRLIRGFLFGMAAADPISFVAAAVLLALVAGIAGYLPAHRASKIDPMIALRYE